MSFYHPIAPFNLHGKTLVVVSTVPYCLCSSKMARSGSGALIPLTRQPVVSTANIAQLAVDLLIASLSLRVIGVFDSRDLVPVVGGREGEEEGISTPLECEFSNSQSHLYNSRSLRGLRHHPLTVFGSEGCDVVVIQQRSPVLVVCTSLRSSTSPTKGCTLPP